MINVLLTDPVGIDREIQELQILLKGELSWLEYSYGRAFQGVKKQTSEPNYLYPAVYTGSRNYYDASPNDNIISQSFFALDQTPYRPTDYETGQYNKYYARVNLIVWGDLRKVNDALNIQREDQHYSHLLLQDVLRVLRMQKSFSVNTILENERGIFDGYGIRSMNPKLFYFPYFCFKISLNGAFEDECDEDIITALHG